MIMGEAAREFDLTQDKLPAWHMARVARMGKPLRAAVG